MKISFLGLLFLSLFYLSHAQEIDLDHIIEMEKKAHLAKKNAMSSTIGKEYDIKYHRLNWEIDPSVNYIKGSVYTEFEVLSTTSFLQFDLKDNMIVDSVLYHGNSVQFNLSNDILNINPGQTLIAGNKDSVQVFYQGTPGSSGFGSWFYGTHSGGPIISTLSEPYGAREWWPCKQSLDDKIDSVDIFVRVPDGNLAASNGILKSSQLQGNDRIMHWSHRYPITCYLIAVSVTNYSQFSNYLPLSNGDSLEILNYCYPQSLNNWQSLAGETVGLLQLYDSLFEPYPFMTEKYGHAEWEWGGGMEHQTMSFMGSLNLSLVAHELAHQWFGDKITCGSWQDIWLNEGFATYLTGLAFENGFGVGSNLWYNWRTAVIGSATSQPGGSVYVDDTTSVNRIFSGRLSYNKGALLLHMLRWKMGDQDFFSSLQNYLQDSSLAFSYARTQDLKYHLENTSGLDLTEFFNDWLYGQGYPSYDLFLEKNINGEYELTINQSQSHPSVSFFEMPVEVEFRAQGVDTTIVFDHISDGQVFTFSLPFEVTEFEFDPELWICAKSTETLSIDDQLSSSELRIFPNPSKGEFTLSSNFRSEEIEEIKFLDYSGKEMEIKIRNMNNGDLRIKTSDLADGLYFLRIKTGKSLISSKIFIQK